MSSHVLQTFHNSGILHRNPDFHLLREKENIRVSGNPRSHGLGPSVCSTGHLLAASPGSDTRPPQPSRTCASPSVPVGVWMRHTCSKYCVLRISKAPASPLSSTKGDILSPFRFSGSYSSYSDSAQGPLYQGRFPWHPSTERFCFPRNSHRNYYSQYLLGTQVYMLTPFLLLSWVAT